MYRMSSRSKCAPRKCQEVFARYGQSASGAFVNPPTFPAVRREPNAFFVLPRPQSESGHPFPGGEAQGAVVTVQKPSAQHFLFLRLGSLLISSQQGREDGRRLSAHLSLFFRSFYSIFLRHSPPKLTICHSIATFYTDQSNYSNLTERNTCKNERLRRNKRLYLRTDVAE